MTLRDDVVRAIREVRYGIEYADRTPTPDEIQGAENIIALCEEAWKRQAVAPDATTHEIDVHDNDDEV